MGHNPIASLGDFMSEAATPWARQFRISVRPLFQADLSCELEGLGTGLLLRQSDHRMLVTAKHVPEDAWADGTAVYGGLLEGGDIVELPGTTAGYPRPRDLAFFVGAEPLLRSVPEANFLDLDRHVAHNSPSPRFCFVLGYRAAKRAVNLNPEEHKARSEMFFYCGTIQGETDINLDVQIDYKKVRHTGMRQQTGELHGISGGAVFGFDPLRPTAHAQLIGIVTGHERRERRLVCTKANVIRQFVRQAHHGINAR